MPRLSAAAKWQQEASKAFRQRVPRKKDEITPDMWVFSFTAAGVQETELLSDLQDLIQQKIDSGTGYEAADYDDFITAATEAIEKHTGGKSPLSPSRLKLIYQTNVRQAYGLAQWRIGVDKWHITRFPCWKFVRTPGAKIKRFAHTYTENWIRPKTDWDFWARKMNARSLGGFEVPYAPFGFNSYMILVPVSRKDAIAAGISAAVIDKQSKLNMRRSAFRNLLPEDWDASHGVISVSGKKGGYKARRRRLQRALDRARKEWSQKGGNPDADFIIDRGKVKIRYRRKRAPEIPAR